MMMLILLAYSSVSLDSSTEKPLVSKEQKILQLNILFLSLLQHSFVDLGSNRISIMCLFGN